MAIKKILVEPNKLLRKVSKPVKEINKEIQSLMDDMLETMYAANGIGLAAIQIGIPKNLIVIDLLTKEKKKDPMFFVNPKIIKKSSDMSKYEEGCLSIPNLFAEYKDQVNAMSSIWIIMERKKFLTLLDCWQHAFNMKLII